ncbi:MAG: hypothetical protein IPP57_17445 [Candidatus Obscuribacter sp.]|jgi:hypothetical protein|nr:hypothetical protein [Candidatus Obscuribacter sp.]MBK7841614.1 hypothetical protein [Candidatus Obscuribacter sp.]MBK9620543.1 hypothetical protein [Candidatus Obscuribacter sp.]MBK9772570.1 hypothetical protein [Candidatus Obscuribacter sp.]MBL0186825.1 hypothetical protein [Candidatus Obscuribacter sp.]
MADDDDLLGRFSITSPCPMSFNDMQGDDKVRFCSQCSKNVHNLSNMSKAEAAELVRKSDGKICAFIRRDERGKIITDNCPQFLRNARNRLFDKIASIASWLVLIGLMPTAFIFTKTMSGGGGGGLTNISAACQAESVRTIAPTIITGWMSFKLITLSASRFRLSKNVESLILLTLPFSFGFFVYFKEVGACRLFFAESIVTGLILAGSTYGFAFLLRRLSKVDQLK